MPGLDDPGVIDLVTEGPDTGVALIIAHDQLWTDSRDEVARLRKKINNYAAYVLDEGLVSAFPEAASRPKRIQLDCVSEPTPDVAELLGAARAALAEYSIGLVVNVLPHVDPDDRG